MKKITLISLATFLVLLFSTTVGYSQTVFSGTAQLEDACVLGHNDCTTASVTIGNVYLGDEFGTAITSCTFGDPLTDVYIWVNVTGSTKENMYVQFDLFKDDLKIDLAGATYNGPQKISNGHVGQFTAGLYRVVKVPDYECGDKLEIKNLFMAWQTNNNNPPGCHNQNSMCNKDLITSTIVVNTPIFANFGIVQSCVGGSFQQVVYTDSTTGGPANKTYSWDFGLGASPATANTAGPHIVTYSSGGLISVSLTVTDPSNTVLPDTETKPITILSCCTVVINSINSTNVQCNGNSDGTVTATKTGGTGTITYNLLYSTTSGGVFTNAIATDGDSDGSYTGLGVGFYKVDVTEANGCSDTSSEVEISQPTSSVSVALTSQTDVLCFGDSTGAINITASGGTAPYTYAWTGVGVSASAEDQSGLAAGAYSVIVTDANGCSTSSLPVTISQPASSVSVALTSQTDVLCFGDSTGAINITAAGGVGPYTYAWTGTGVNATAEDQTGLTAGEYKVIVTDNNGCSSAELTVNITQPSATLSASATGESLYCAGDSDGDIALNVSGGTPTYTYSWVNDSDTNTVVSTDEDPSGFSAGDYTVTITDANGCTITASATIIDGDGTNPVVTAPADDSLEGCDTSAIIGWVYSETPVDITNSYIGVGVVENGTGIASVTYSDSSSGSCPIVVTRTFTVTDNCGNVGTDTQEISIVDTTAPVLTIPTNASIECTDDISPNALGTATATDNCDGSLTPTYTDGDCFGLENEKEVNAGNGIYQYFNISGMAGLGVNSIKDFTLTFETNQGKGRAEFILVAPNGKGIVLVGPYCAGGDCDDNDGDTETYSPTFYPSTSGYDAWVNSNLIAEGSGNFEPNGGTSPNSGSITGLTNGLVSTFEALTAGMGSLDGQWFVYSKKQENVNGNVRFISSCLTPGLNASCANNDVVIREWTVTDACGNTSTGNQVIVISDTTAPVATGSITATNIEGCSIEDAPAAVTTVAELEALTGDLSISDNCSDDADLTVSSSDDVSGTCPIVITRTYKVTDECSNESVDIIHIININDTTDPTGTAPADITDLKDIANVPAADIEAILDEADNCSDVTVTVNDTNNEGSGCSGDAYIVTRTFTLTDACGNDIDLVQTITVEADAVVADDPSDVTECESYTLPALTNGAYFGTSGGVNPIAVGTVITETATIYVYAVSADNANCTAENSFLVTINALPAAPISGGDQSECETSPIQTLTATATVPEGFSVVWYDAATEGNVVENPTLNSVGSVTYYAESVNDDTECISNSRTAVNLEILAAPVAPISGGNQTVCSNGSITQTLTATATGGIITWYTAVTGGSIVTSPTQVGVGTSTYYAESSNETCSSLTRTAVTLTINAAPIAPISGGNQTVCSDGSTTQTLTATATGGTITWYTSSTGGSVVTSPTQVGVGTSTYYAQSSNGTCSSLTRTAVTLTINAAPVAPISGGNQTVCSDGTTTQTLTATATGGTITWYTSATGGSLVTSPTQVGVGTSTYYAESSNETCSSLTRTAVTLTINPTPEVTISGNSVLTCANESIALTATVQGAASYLWNTGATTATIEVTESGEYSVTVTDSNSGCSASETVTVIGDATPPAANISGNGVLTCVTQSITLTASATVQGTASYLWNTGATTATIEVTAAGEYSVVVTDSDNGCSSTAAVTVAQNTTPPTVAITGPTELTCNITSITLNASGSVVQGAASYLWNNGATTASIEVSQAGEYTVVVTDSGNGCSTAKTITVTENYVAAEITGGSIALCIEDANLDLTSLLPSDFVSGGTWSDDMNSGGLTGNSFDPSVVNLGDYEFTYTEPGDCGRIITVAVNVNDDCVVLACSTDDIKISKAVTPNGDNWNENFEITGLDGCDFTIGVKIFNRWGKMVYESNNYLNNWNGRHDGSGIKIGSNSELPTGTYYYIVTVSGGTGFTPMTGYIYLGTH